MSPHAKLFYHCNIIIFFFVLEDTDSSLMGPMQHVNTCVSTLKIWLMGTAEVLHMEVLFVNIKNNENQELYMEHLSFTKD